MKSFNERLNEVMVEKNISSAELCRRTGIPKSAMSQYRSGSFSPKADRIYIIAKALNVSEAWLMGYNVPQEREASNGRVVKFNYPEISEEYVEYPVIGDVAAGFDKIAIEDWTEDTIKIHPDFLKGKPREDYFVLRVRGDSMYPLYLDGDKVLVRRQNAVDYSGQIAVIIYGEDYGTIKKVEYRKDSVALIPINPQYAPEIITDLNTETFEILGIPALLVREIEE